MTQGLTMFDAQGRITLINRRYLDMYKLSPEIVKPGCMLKQLIQHRKDTGLFAGDVDAYCRMIMAGAGERRKLVALCAGQRRPLGARQERTAARRRLGVDP